MWSRNLWVFVFCVVTCFVYVHFLREKKQQLILLNMRLNKMEQEKLQALTQRENLELHIASQSDPAWIEMILIRDLGVVPEGFLKVHFRK